MSPIEPSRTPVLRLISLALLVFSVAACTCSPALANPMSGDFAGKPPAYPPLVLWIDYCGLILALAYGIRHTQMHKPHMFQKLRCELALTALLAIAPIVSAADRPSSPEPRAPSPTTQRPDDPAIQKPGWTLTFHDEFDGTKLDTKKWIDSYPHNRRTHANNEQQYYAKDGYEVKDGMLRLKAEKRRMGGMPYTSGMISSFGKFSQKYGWFEIRARFPKGKGMWPAFWLLPVTDNWPPEIDILEILGHDPNKIYFSTHYTTPGKGHEYTTGFWVGPDFTKEFHTIAVEWEPGFCVWYVDGIERHRHTEGVPDEPMYILANLAVGGDWPGMPDAATPFPGYMDIDYIRVYKKKPDDGTDGPPPPPPFKKP